MTSDKFGAELKKGDHIDFVHFGDHHTAQIKDFHTQTFGDIQMVEVEITVHVPSGAVTRLDKQAEEPKEPVAPPARDDQHAGETLAGEQRPGDQIKTKAAARAEEKKASK